VNHKQSSRRYYVSGMVQGVGYRHFVAWTAERLEVAGFTRNLRDGRVEVYAIGTAESLAALRAELERGPRAARVERVSEEEAGLEQRWARGFSVEFDD